MKAVTKLLLPVLLTLSGHLASAQNRPKLVDNYVAHLQQKGVDTILIYINSCSECLVEVNKPNCNCLDSLSINEIYVIYQNKGKIYKVDFSCCNGDDTVAVNSGKSIPYFLSLEKVFREKDNFYNDPNNQKALPSTPTDDPFEDVELICGKKQLKFISYFSQRHEAYNNWKQYFWVDKELKIVNLIRQDLSIP